MNPTTLTNSSRPPAQAAAWGAVLAMSLGAFVLVASEFMPVSLLTPIAADLHISEGQAGQAIAIPDLRPLLEGVTHIGVASLSLMLLLMGVAGFVGTTLIGVPVLMAAIAGLLGTSAPVGWWTWLARALPDDAEAGGGLVFDGSGYRATFFLGATVLVLAAITAWLAARASRRTAA